MELAYCIKSILDAKMRIILICISIFLHLRPSPSRKTRMNSPLRLPLALALALTYPTHAFAADAMEAPELPASPSTVLISADRLENSYASDAAGVAKGSRSLRETPQSVSVANR